MDDDRLEVTLVRQNRRRCASQLAVCRASALPQCRVRQTMEDQGSVMLIPRMDLLIRVTGGASVLAANQRGFAFLVLHCVVSRPHPSWKE
jgi:hypothetical protein